MCVEAGGFEAMGVRAAQSLRKFGGRFSSCKMYAVTPRRGAALSRSTLAAFDDLGVDYLNVRPSNPYAWYPMMNKPLTVLAAAERSTAEQIVFLDADMVLLSEPNLLQLDDQTDFAAVASDKNIGSASEEDLNTPFWKEICAILGIEFSELPWVHAHRENIDIRIYFNGGLFAFRRTRPFAVAYQQAVARLLDAKLSSQVSDIYFHEQASIGLVAFKEKLRWKALPHVYNYAVGRKIMDKYEPQKVQQAVVLHYHDMMWPENWTNLMDRLKVDRPEVHDWLATLGPLKLTGSKMQKMTGKLIGSFRKRKMDRHKASCRVL